MELHQRVKIPVPQHAVWAGLNDPAMLKASLPGCEAFELVSANEFTVILLARVGPVKARFTGDVSLTEVNPPNAYKINGSGKGGVAGFARGGAEVRLEPVDDGAATQMTYRVTASVGGKLAQIGSRLVSGAARKMADDFFSGFVRALSGDESMEVQIETIES